MGTSTVLRLRIFSVACAFTSVIVLIIGMVAAADIRILVAATVITGLSSVLMGFATYTKINKTPFGTDSEQAYSQSDLIDFSNDGAIVIPPTGAAGNQGIPRSKGSTPFGSEESPSQDRSKLIPVAAQ